MIPKYLLIQRLEFPPKQSSRLVNAPFQWGGGYRNGGFDENIYRRLMKIFVFAHMGSAEYEWGDVPRAFTALHVFEKDGKLAQNEVETDHEKVYYICHADDQKEVEKVLKKLAAGELLRNMKGGYRTRDGVWLHEALLNKAHEPFDVAGGVCIGDSPFLYVVDVAMLEKLRRLFQKS